MDWPQLPATEAAAVSSAAPAAGAGKMTAEPGGGRIDIFAAANFQRTACRFPVKPGQVVECADLNVPENSGQPGGRTIRLHVARFQAGENPQPDPVIYLHGGPGGGALANIAAMYAYGFRHLFPDRDFIAYDQRGVGFSVPRLACPELALAYALSLAQDERASLLGWEAAHSQACLAKLAGTGANLAAYSTAASAADLEALIQALGYEQVNLFGQSYGTHLALAYLNEYGSRGRVRSMLLDGVYPLQADTLVARGRHAWAAWQAVFAACAADAGCQRAYPDLEQRFLRLLERLAQQPITLQVSNPLTGSDQPVVLNDFRLIEAVYRSSYVSGWIPKFPALIAELEQGDGALAREALENVFLTGASTDQGAYYAVTCNDGAGLVSAEAIRAANAALPEAVRAYFDELGLGVLAACQALAGESAPLARRQAAVSDVPALLLSGAFDPITPPALAKLAAETLSRGYVSVFPAESHDLLGSNLCAQLVAYQFLQDPVMPVDECLDALPGPQWGP